MASTKSWLASGMVSLLAVLDQSFGRWRRERGVAEAFGDFADRVLLAEVPT